MMYRDQSDCFMFETLGPAKTLSLLARLLEPKLSTEDKLQDSGSHFFSTMGSAGVRGIAAYLAGEARRLARHTTDNRDADWNYGFLPNRKKIQEIIDQITLLAILLERWDQDEQPDGFHEGDMDGLAHWLEWLSRDLESWDKEAAQVDRDPRWQVEENRAEFHGRDTDGNPVRSSVLIKRAKPKIDTTAEAAEMER